MSHVRQQIRDEVVTELSSLDPIPFQSVHSTRLYNFRVDQLPALNVYSQGEESEAATMGAALGSNGSNRRNMTRVLLLATECYLSVTDDIDDAMDALAVPVETVLQDTLLDDLVADVQLTTTTFEIDSAGEVPVAVLTLVWRIVYRTLEGEPEVSV
jgi:hypothetical protein